MLESSARSAPTVLSLDLGETVIWDSAEIAEAQTAVRVEVLAEGLRRPDGSVYTVAEVAGARKEVLALWRTKGLFASSLPNSTLVSEVQEKLGASLTLALGTLADRYSDAGLREHPPHVNPEAQELVRGLNAEGIRVLAISNTSRSGRTWREFLRDAGGMRFEEVVASCDLSCRKPDPRNFLEGARRMAVPPASILHIGDRWDRDVEGALASGMQAALYRGLWSRQWNLEEGPSMPPPAGSTVPCLDHLTEARALLAHG